MNSFSRISYIAAIYRNRLQLGGFKQIVLLSVAAQLGEAYGVTIKLHIEAHCERRVSTGALQTILSRLERRALGIPSCERLRA
ncbi:MAG: hypothetical protein AAGA10_27920 [Bacteroidota bacterium]